MSAGGVEAAVVLLRSAWTLAVLPPPVVLLKGSAANPLTVLALPVVLLRAQRPRWLVFWLPVVLLKAH